MRLAVDEINADGGVDGRPLELVVADDQSNAEEGISQIERLIEDGVVAVGGVISSDVGQPANLIYRRLRDTGHEVFAVNCTAAWARAPARRKRSPRAARAASP